MKYLWITPLEYVCGWGRMEGMKEIKCSYCGEIVPPTWEPVKSGDYYFCSEECLEVYLQNI